MTSPPGGGTIARPRRASRGPARRNDARIRLQSSASSSCRSTRPPPTRPSFGPGEALRRHALAVEASVGGYARRFGEDEELWRAVALLHDFDYERHPTLDKHPQDGAPILREEGWPEDVIEAVLSHAEHLELPRDTP